MSLIWRLTNGKDDDGKFRFDPYESLMEAKPDAWLIQWKDEKPDSVLGETMCGPMLNDFIAECAYILFERGQSEQRKHLMEMSKDNRIAAARQAAQMVADLAIEFGDTYVRGLFHGFCSKARGSLR